MNIPPIKILLTTTLSILIAISIQNHWDPNENHLMNIATLIDIYLSPKIEWIFNKPLETQVKFLQFLTFTSEFTSKYEFLMRYAFGEDVADASFDEETNSHVVMIPPSKSLHHEQILCACPQQRTQNDNDNDDEKTMKLPLVLNFHPGGLIIGTTEGWFYEARYLSVQTNTLVCSIDYKLAPQYTFPAAINDAVNGSLALIGYNNDQPYQNLIEETCGSTIDYTKIATFGYSVGGHLAAHVARILSTKYNTKIAVQILRAPMVTPPFGGISPSKSLMQHWNAPFWNGPMNVYAWSVYLDNYSGGDGDDDGDDRKAVNDYRVNLLVDPPDEDIEKLPPAYVQIGTKDVLRDEGEMYANHLQKQGKLIALDEYNTNHAGIMLGLSRNGGPGEYAFQRSMNILEHILQCHPTHFGICEGGKYSVSRMNKD